MHMKLQVIFKSNVNKRKYTEFFFRKLSCRKQAHQCRRRFIDRQRGISVDLLMKILMENNHDEPGKRSLHKRRRQRSSDAGDRVGPHKKYVVSPRIKVAPTVRTDRPRGVLRENIGVIAE